MKGQIEAQSITAGSSIDGANVTLTYGVQPLAGDVIYIWGGHYDRGSVGPQSGYSFTELNNTVVDSAGVTPYRWGLWRRICDGNEALTVVCQGSGNAADAASYGHFLLRGVDQTTPEDVAVVGTSGTSGSADAPSVTTATTNALVLALYGINANDSAPGTLTNHTNPIGSGAADTNPTSVAGALRYPMGAAGTADDPGTWSAWATSTRWRALSVAVRPAPVSDTRFIGVINGTAIDGAAITIALDAAIDITGIGTGTSILPGDFMVACWAGFNRSSAVGAFTDSVGRTWNEIVNLTQSNRVRVAWLIAGTETGHTLTAAATGNAADGSSLSLAIFRGVDQTTPLSVATTTAQASLGAPNPPSITPAHNDCLVVAGYGANVGDSTPGNVLSTDATRFYNKAAIASSTADTNDSQVGWAYLAVAGGAGVAEDGGAYDSYSTANWVAFTLALKPVSWDATLFSNTNSFFTQSIAPGEVGLTGTLYSNDNSFFTQVVTSPITLTETLFSSNNAFFTQEVTVDDATLIGALYSDANSFFTQDIAASITLTESLFSATSAFFTQSVTAEVALTGTLFSTTSAFFTQSVAAGEVDLTGTLFSTSNAFFTQSVAAGDVTLTGTLYSDANSFFTQSISGSIILIGTVYTDVDAFFTQSVAAGEVDLTESLFSATNSFFTHSVAAGEVGLAASLFSDADSFFTQAIFSDAFVLSVTQFSDTNAFFTQSVLVGEVDLTANLYVDADAFFALTVTVGDVTLTADLFVATNAFFLQGIGGEELLLFPELFSGLATFYPQEINTTPVYRSNIFVTSYKEARIIQLAEQVMTIPTPPARDDELIQTTSTKPSTGHAAPAVTPSATVVTKSSTIRVTGSIHR